MLGHCCNIGSTSRVLWAWACPPPPPPPFGLHEGDAIPGIEQLFPESQEEDVGDSAQAADKRDKVINQPLAVGEYVQI